LKKSNFFFFFSELMSTPPSSGVSLLAQAKELFSSVNSVGSPTSPTDGHTGLTRSDSSYDSSRSSDLVSEGQIQRTGFAHVVTARLHFFFSQGEARHRKHFHKLVDVVDAMLYVAKERPSALYLMHALSELSVAISVLASDLCDSIEEEDEGTREDFSMSSETNNQAILQDTTTSTSFSASSIMKTFKGCLSTYREILTYESSVEVRQRRQPSDSDIDSQRNALRRITYLISYAAKYKSAHSEMQSVIEEVISFLFEASSGNYGEIVKENSIFSLCIAESASMLSRSRQSSASLPLDEPEMKDLTDDIPEYSVAGESIKVIHSNLSDASSAVSTLSTAKDYPNALSHTALLIGNPFFASSHIRCAQLVEKVLKVKPESLSDSAALLISSHIRLPECSKDLFSHLVSVLALHCEASPKRTSLLAQMNTSGRDLLTFFSHRLQECLPAPTFIDTKPFGRGRVVAHRGDIVVISLNWGGKLYMHKDTVIVNQIQEQQSERLSQERKADISNILLLTSQILVCTDAPLHVGADALTLKLRLSFLPEVANAVFCLFLWLSVCLETTHGETTLSDKTSLFSKASQAAFSVLRVPSYRNALLSESITLVSTPSDSEYSDKNRSLYASTRLLEPISILSLLNDLAAHPSHELVDTAIIECGALFTALVESNEETLPLSPFCLGSSRLVPYLPLRNTAWVCGNCETVNTPSFTQAANCIMCDKGCKLSAVTLRRGVDPVNVKTPTESKIETFPVASPPRVTTVASFGPPYAATKDTSDVNLHMSHISGMNAYQDLSPEEIRAKTGNVEDSQSNVSSSSSVMVPAPFGVASSSSSFSFAPAHASAPFSFAPAAAPAAAPAPATFSLAPEPAPVASSASFSFAHVISPAPFGFSLAPVPAPAPVPALVPFSFANVNAPAPYGFSPPPAPSHFVVDAPKDGSFQVFSSGSPSAPGPLSASSISTGYAGSFKKKATTGTTGTTRTKTFTKTPDKSSTFTFGLPSSSTTSPLFPGFLSSPSSSKEVFPEGNDPSLTMFNRSLHVILIKKSLPALDMFMDTVFSKVTATASTQIQKSVDLTKSLQFLLDMRALGLLTLDSGLMQKWRDHLVSALSPLVISNTRAIALVLFAVLSAVSFAKRSQKTVSLLEQRETSSKVAESVHSHAVSNLLKMFPVVVTLGLSISKLSEGLNRRVVRLSLPAINSLSLCADLIEAVKLCGITDAVVPVGMNNCNDSMTWKKAFHTTLVRSLLGFSSPIDFSSCAALPAWHYWNKVERTGSSVHSLISIISKMIISSGSFETGPLNLERESGIAAFNLLLALSSEPLAAKDIESTDFIRTLCELYFDVNLQVGLAAQYPSTSAVPLATSSPVGSSVPQKKPSLFCKQDILRIMSQTFEGLTIAREIYSFTQNDANQEIDRVCASDFTPSLASIIDEISKIMFQIQPDQFVSREGRPVSNQTQPSIGWSKSIFTSSSGCSVFVWLNSRTGVATFIEPVRNSPSVNPVAVYIDAAPRVRLLRALLRHISGSSCSRAVIPGQVFKTLTALNATVLSCVSTLLSTVASVPDGENLCAFLADILGSLAEVEVLQPRCIRSQPDFSGVDFSRTSREIVMFSEEPRFAAVGIELAASKSAWQRLRLEAAVLLGQIGLTQEYPYSRCGEAIKDVIALTESALETLDIVASPLLVRALSGIAGSMEPSGDLQGAPNKPFGAPNKPFGFSGVGGVGGFGSSSSTNTTLSSSSTTVSGEGSKQLRILVRQSHVVSKLASWLDHLSKENSSSDRNGLDKMIPITSLLLSRVYRATDAVSGNEFSSAIKLTIWMMSCKRSGMDALLNATTTLCSLAASCRFESVSDRFGEFLRSPTGTHFVSALLYCMERARSRLHGEILPTRAREVKDENARFRRSQETKNSDGFMHKPSSIDYPEAHLCGEILKMGAKVFDELVKPNPFYENNIADSPAFGLGDCFLRINEQMTPSFIMSQPIPVADSMTLVIDSTISPVTSTEKVTLDKRQFILTALQWLKDAEILEHCDLVLKHSAGSKEIDAVESSCRSWNKSSLFKAIISCLKTNLKLRNAYRDTFFLEMLSSSIDLSTASSETLTIISDMIAILAEPEKTSIRNIDTIEVSNKRRLFLDDPLLSTMTETIRSSHLLVGFEPTDGKNVGKFGASYNSSSSNSASSNSFPDAMSFDKLAYIRVNILRVCRVLITEPGKVLPSTLIIEVVKKDLPREVEHSKKLDEDWKTKAKQAADKLASAQQAYSSSSTSSSSSSTTSTAPFFVTDEMKPPPPVDHSVLTMLLDILNTTTAYAITAPTSKDEIVPKNPSQVQRNQILSLSTEMSSPTVSESLLTLGRSVLDTLSETSIKVLLSSITISSEQVVKLALVLLSSTLYSIESHSEMRAFRRDLYVPVYEILADEKKPSASRAAAASVISVALDNCRDDAEVEELCSNLAVSPNIKSKPIHPHSLTQDVNKKFNCDICGKADVSNAWGCRTCDYDECNDCYMARQRPPLKPVELLSKLVSISSGLDSTDDSARHDLSAAMPTLFVAIQAIGKLLDSGGERGKAFKRQAQAFDLSDKILRAGELASKAGGGKSSEEAEMGERVFRLANFLHAKHFMSKDREHHLVEFEHPDEVKQRALEAEEIKKIAIEAAEAAAKAKADAKEVDDDLTTYMSVSQASSLTDSALLEKKKIDSIQLPLANRIRGLVPVLLETRILPPRALKRLVEMLEQISSQSTQSVVQSIDPYAKADSKLRKGIYSLLKKDYKTAYESCDQSDDKRGLIYSALAQLKNGWDPVEPKRRLNEYNAYLEMSSDTIPLDPVVLYVMYVLHTQLRPIQQHREIATLYLRAFGLFEVSSLWLGPKDTIDHVIKSSKGDDFIADESDDPSGPKAMWDQAKLRKGAKSSAMDELMSMVGLKKIKQEAFSFWSSVELAKSRPQAANAGLNRNFVFLGNPGTGKTVVAEILSRALNELGVRLAPLPSGFHKLSGAEALRDGPSEFKKLLNRIEGGTLFLDEVYQLQPKQNNDGRDIMNLLLTYAEEKRETTTIILAGYMDEINDLLSFNPGLTSRFPNMWNFEDYSERDLQQIFEKMVSDRAHIVAQHTPSISRVVAARLSKGRGMPGFANARAVRNIVDASCKRLSERLAPRIIDGATGSVGSPDGLKKEDLVTLSREDVLGEKPDLENTPELGELRRLTGLDEVKEKVVELMHLQMANFDREQRGEKTLDIPLHRIFYGKPGTGKTTVAKIFGRLLKRFGFLSNGDVVVKGPADFLGDATGVSEKKTIDILESCRGKVLVIDECYGLNPKRGGNSFAGNVIDTLVQRVQGTPGEDIAIILCGYEDEVNALLRDANPGLSRRFRSEDAFRFVDYTNSQLVDILREKVRAAGLSITLPTAEGAIAIVSRERAKPNFGNAGAVENLLSRAKERMQSRLTKALAEHRREAEAAAAAAVAAEERSTGGPSTARREGSGNAVMAARVAASSTSVINQSLLVPEDFDKNPASFDCVRKILDDLVGVEFIHEYFEEVEASVEDAKAEGRDPQVLDHLVFSGAPGVGKSTIASRFGKILYTCGLLPSDTVVKQSGRTLQDRYLGGTQAKVQETMRSALGGVLFIDEAGGLGGSGRENDFLKEAVGTMLQLMNTEEYKGKIVIILADTDENIDSLFDVNAAFSSRFSKRIRFNKWDSKQAAAVCEKTLTDDRIDLADGALDALEEGCERLMDRPGWANGRTVKETLLSLVKKKRALRRNRAAKLAKETTSGGGGDSLVSSKSVVIDDIYAALDELIPKPQVRSIPRLSSIERTSSIGSSWNPIERSKSSKDAASVPTSAINGRSPPHFHNHGDNKKSTNDHDHDHDVQIQTLTSVAHAQATRANARMNTHTHSDKEGETNEREEEDTENFTSFEERLADMEDTEVDEQYAIQELGMCVAGYPWDKLPTGGYVCQGGSHALSADAVKAAVASFKKSGKGKNPKLWKN
jgi:SpoVK/Ycf46/Vps4 family AAA+-type ATPase